MMLSRRGLITGLISFVAAPAIVRAGSLMPVKAIEDFEFSGFYSAYPISDGLNWTELCRITREAFVPGCSFQLYEGIPILELIKSVDTSPASCAGENLA